MIELWPILMRKTAITTTFYFTEEEQNIRKEGQIAMAMILMRTFLTLAVIFIWKRL